jgi:hypothetical protein
MFQSLVAQIKMTDPLVPIEIILPKDPGTPQILHGGVGHCSAWHVQVSSGLIDFNLI